MNCFLFKLFVLIKTFFVENKNVFLHPLQPNATSFHSYLHFPNKSVLIWLRVSHNITRRFSKFNLEKGVWIWKVSLIELFFLSKSVWILIVFEYDSKVYIAKRLKMIQLFFLSKVSMIEQLFMSKVNTISLEGFQSSIF